MSTSSRPGDVVEIQYLVDDVGSDNQMADYFGDLQFIGETIPKRRWDYTLIAPVSRPIYSNVPKLARLDRQVTVEGSDRVYRFAARDVAKVDAEPAMPGVGETSPYLHVSTYASWNDVGAWYWRLVEESLAADDEIRRTARGLPQMSGSMLLAFCLSLAAMLALFATFYQLELAGKRLDARLRELREALA